MVPDHGNGECKFHDKVDKNCHIFDILGQNIDKLRTVKIQMSETQTKFTFILQPEFPLAALVLASEALRIANQNSGQKLFEWQFVSETGRQMRASNGMWFAADCDLASADEADVCLLFEGNLPTQHISQKLLGYLRTAARYGAVVGGVDTGAYALAQAGLAGSGDDHDIVLHWEAVPAFREWFQELRPRNRIFQLNDKLANSAGGVATLDLMLALIARYCGEAMANEVANAMIHTRRDHEVRQRADQRFVAEHDNPVSQLVSLMERNLDFPLTLEELASKSGLAIRTLSRITSRTFGTSPMRLYLRVRLQAARNLLFYEEHSIKEIANVCGFSYPAVFSRCFKSQFGRSPTQFRADLRARQKSSFRPEIRRLIGKGGS